MSKTKEKKFVLTPDPNIWRLDVPNGIPLSHLRSTSMKFEPISRLVLYSSEFSKRSKSWKTKIARLLEGKTVDVVIPSTVIQDEPVSFFIILPKLEDLKKEEGWGRESLLVQLSWHDFTHLYKKTR